VIPWTGLLHYAQLLLLLLLLLLTTRLLKLPRQGLCLAALAALERPGENQVNGALQHLHLHVWRLDVWHTTACCNIEDQAAQQLVVTAAGYVVAYRMSTCLGTNVVQWVRPTPALRHYKLLNCIMFT
jgi:hypothetical protein